MDHFTEWTFEGDLNNIHKAYRAMYQQQEQPGTEPVINPERMIVRAREGMCESTAKLSGTAIIRFYYRLKQQLETVFVYLQTKPQYMILITFKTDFFQKNILKIWRKK